jgi:hypothetical protein
MANALAARGTLIGAHACEQPSLRRGVLARDEQKEGGGTATVTANKKTVGSSPSYSHRPNLHDHRHPRPRHEPLARARLK